MVDCVALRCVALRGWRPILSLFTRAGPSLATSDVAISNRYLKRPGFWPLLKVQYLGGISDLKVDRRIYSEEMNE